MFDKELLSRLQAFPTLAEARRTRPGIPDVDSWPWPWQDSWRSVYREYCRVTGRGSLRLAFATKTSVDRVVKLCLETDAKLTVHCSPQLYPVVGDWQSLTRALDAHGSQWDDVLEWIGGRVPVDRVRFDSEPKNFKYRWRARTARHRLQNKMIGAFNTGLYEKIKRLCGDGCTVGWYDHLSSPHGAIENGLDGVAFQSWTSPTDPDDLGFGISAYQPADFDKTVQLLRDQIARASLFQSVKGTIWFPLGHSQAHDQVPGIETAEHLTGKQWIFPYNTVNTHLYGRMVVNNDWCDQRANGISQRGGRYIPGERVEGVCFWRSPFDDHEVLPYAQGPHLIAFFNGLLGRRFDASLHEWQKTLWESRPLDN